MDLSTNRRINSRLLGALVAGVLLAGAAAWVPPAAGAARRGLPGPEVTCASCLVVVDGREVLWRREAGAARPNASTTKMVTALVVVEHAALDEQVVVGRTAAATGGGGLALAAGDRYTVGELLYALLLSSSNDAAIALAEHVASSEGAFVTLMNDLAADLGATDSYFATAHGLDAPGHYSTARDLARIATAVLSDPALAPIVAAPGAKIEGPDGTVALENRNSLLEAYRGATGVKTGYTAGAGNVLVASAERHGRVVVAVAMGSVDAAADAARLLDYGFTRLARTILLRDNEPVGALVFDPGGATTIVAASTVRGPVDPAELETTLVVGDPAIPLAAGEDVGSVVLEAGGRVVATVDAVATSAVTDGAAAAEAGSPAAWAASVLSAVLRAVGGRIVPLLAD